MSLRSQIQPVALLLVMEVNIKWVLSKQHYLVA